jgi:hypothetical protein
MSTPPCTVCMVRYVTVLAGIRWSPYLVVVNVPLLNGQNGLQVTRSDAPESQLDDSVPVQYPVVMSEITYTRQDVGIMT